MALQSFDKRRTIWQKFCCWALHIRVDAYHPFVGYITTCRNDYYMRIDPKSKASK